MASFGEAWQDMGKHALVNFGQLIRDYVDIMDVNLGLVGMAMSKPEGAPAGGIGIGALVGAGFIAVSTGIDQALGLKKGTWKGVLMEVATKGKMSPGTDPLGAQIVGQLADPGFWEKMKRAAAPGYSLVVKSYTRQREMEKTMRKSRRAIMGALADMPIPTFAKREIEGKLRMQEMDTIESLNLQRLAANITPALGFYAGGMFHPIKIIIDEVQARKQRAALRRRRERTVIAFEQSFQESVVSGDEIRKAIATYRAEEEQMTREARINRLIEIKTLVPTEQHVYDALPWLMPTEQDFILALDMLIDLYSKVGDDV